MHPSFLTAAAALTLFGFATTMLPAAPIPPAVTLAHGLVFPEGSTLSADGKTLYIVNVQANFISRLDLKTNTLTREWVRLPAGGRGNGLTLGPDGALYVADVGRRCIARISLKDKAVTMIADRTETGAAFRGPNDLVFDTHGGLYFTDPDGSWNEPLGAVYYAAPKTHKVSKVAEGLRFPNGLVLSPDERTLYVAESPLHRISRIDLTPNGTMPPGRKSVFAVVATTGGPDGMRWGPDGQLYAAIFGDGAVVRVNTAGKITGRVSIPQGSQPTNLCFSADGTALFVTEAESHCVVRLSRSSLTPPL